MNQDINTDAPYGYKLDGTPKRKPGRKSDKERARIAARNERKAAKATKKF